MKRWCVRLAGITVSLVCSFGRASGQSAAPSATLISVSLPARMVPGGTLPVTARLRIRNTAASGVRMVFTGPSPTTPPWYRCSFRPSRNKRSSRREVSPV